MSFLKWPFGPDAAALADDLINAAERGDVATAQALLTAGHAWWNPFAKGVDVNAKRKYWGLTALMEASRGGHRDIVQALLDKGANVNAKGDRGETALMEASKEGHRDIVQALLDKGADINAKHDYGKTALIMAFGQGHDDVAQLLIAKGDDVNPKGDSDGTSLLILASREGHRDIVQALLDKGADVNAMGKGQIALIAASWKGHRDIVQVLLDKGADVNAKTISGDTALILASQEGHRNVVQLLLAKGAEDDLIAAASRGDAAAVQALLDKGADDNHRDTALMRASRGGHVEVVQVLLGTRLAPASANITEEVPDGPVMSLMNAQKNGMAPSDSATSLPTLVNLAPKNEPERVEQNLLRGERPGVPGLMADERNKYSRFAVVDRRRSFDVEAPPKAPIGARARVNATFSDGKTALMMASGGGHLAVVQALLEKGADVDASDNLSRTALILAADNGHLEVVKELLEKGAKLGVRSCEGRTALMRASGGGHLAVVRALLDARADVNAKDNDGQTALMMASGDGHLAVVRALLDARADVNAKDNDGQTALMRASKEDRGEVMQVLLGKGAAPAHVSVGKQSAAEKEFEETVIALAELAKTRISKIREARPKGIGKAELMEEARQKLQAIEEINRVSTISAMMAMDAIVSKYHLSPDQRDKMLARLNPQNVKE